MTENKDNSSSSEDIQQLISLLKSFVSFIKTVGPWASAVLSLTGVSSYNFLKSDEDPFLVYYTVVSLFFVIGLMVVMKMTSDKNQKITSILWFIFTAVGAVIAVYWRYDRIERFIYHDMNIIYCPTDICGGAHDYLPYFLLLAPVVVVSLWIIISNTSSQVNSNNKVPILSMFIVMLFFLLASRVAWDKVDDYGIKHACPICEESRTSTPD